MKISLKTVLAALLLTGVPVALAQDVGSDVKKTAKDTAPKPRRLPKKTGHATRKPQIRLKTLQKRRPRRLDTPPRQRPRKPPCHEKAAIKLKTPQKPLQENRQWRKKGTKPQARK